MRTNDPGVATAMIQMAAQVLDEEYLGGVDETALRGELAALWPALCRLQAQFSRRTAALARLEGAAATRGWLASRLHLDEVDAAREVAVGMGLAALPATAVAFLRGHISTSHAEVIVRTANRYGPAALAGNGEAALLTLARHGTPMQVRLATLRLVDPNRRPRPRDRHDQPDAGPGGHGPGDLPAAGTRRTGTAGAA